MTPAVTIVMPVSNSERFLSETLDSLLAQTLTDFECIVVDNGSTDRTPEMLAAYGQQDPRIRLFRHPQNLGPSVARNTGGAAARSELIAVMDHDDVALPDRLEKQACFMANHPDIAAVGGAVQIIDGAGAPGATLSFSEIPGLVAWSWLFFNSMVHPTVMMRRDAFRRAGGYSVDHLAADDHGLLMRMSRQARIANLPDVLLRYRWWGGNTTRVSAERQEAESNEIVQTNIRELSGMDVTLGDAEALRGLAREDYPEDAEGLERLANIIDTLVPVYLDRIARTAEDRTAISRDAGIRLWLLTALAEQSAPRLVDRLGARAARLSPRASLSVAAKASLSLFPPRATVDQEGL